MFLGKVIQQNKKLVDTAFSLHQQGRIEPDSYVVDVDQFLANAKIILSTAKEKGIHLYFMLKQLGRNPYLAKELVKLGYKGAVAVDFREAEVMMKHKIPLGNVGHLVQIPEGNIEKIVDYGTEVITVYSIDKINSINKIAKKLNKTQGILLRVCDEEDLIYSGQTGGFLLKDLEEVTKKVLNMKNVQIKGVTSFPCYIFNENNRQFEPTPNLCTVNKAVEILKKIGIEPEIINTPSGSCTSTLRRMKNDGGNCAEPGHGLTGTTPASAINDMDEKISVVYISEISHNFKGNSYCYGGGFYRRSHVQYALCGTNSNNARTLEVIPPELESIDYHFGLSEEAVVGETVLMAFRFQIFVTRSDVVLVKGISEEKPEIVGVFDSLGNEK